MIRIMHLTKNYGKARGVTDLTLHVPAGSCFGFIGPNGAGKSTTIRTLLGLISPTSGSAEVLGLDCVKDRPAILAQVGYMPSEAMFYPEMRVAEVIRLSADLRRRDCRAEAAALCRALDLDPRKKIRELSLGNRKKVSIVCAMQHRPRLYVLDEPTSGLDPVSRDELLTIFRALAADGRRSILYSTHITSDLEKCADDITYIKDGRVLASGEKGAFLDSFQHLRTRSDAAPLTLEDIMVRTERREFHV